MTDYNWDKVDPDKIQGTEQERFVLENAPPILYTKMDKAISSINSLIILLFMVGFYLIYVSIQYTIGFTVGGIDFIIFVIATIIVVIAAIPLLLIYFRSSGYNKLVKSYYEVYIAHSDNNDAVYYCMVYYPTFSGKIHPNKAFNFAYKLYEKSVLSNSQDVTQVEVYYKGSKRSSEILKNIEKLGYFFNYGEGQEFFREKLNKNAWKFFEGTKSENDNLIAISNWYHLYEWRDDLVLDFDKLHELAPWVVFRWNNLTMVPLTNEIKTTLHFNKRSILAQPKLKPWSSDLKTQEYQGDLADKDLNLVQKAIDNILGGITNITKKLVKQNAETFKKYFIENA